MTLSSPSLRSRFLSALVLACVLGAGLMGCSSSKEAASPSWIQGDAYDIKVRLNSGDTLRTDMEMNQSIEMNMMGQTIPMQQMQRFEHTYAIVEVEPGGNYLMEQTMTRVAGSTEGQMVPSQSYDSAADEGEQGAIPPGTRAVLDQAIRFVMTPSGDIESTEGIEEMVARMSDEMPDSTSRAQLEEMLDPQTIQENLRVFAYSPDSLVQIGDSWSESMSMQVAFPIDMNATYTLNRVEGETAYLDMVVDVSSPDDPEPMDMGGATMTMQMAGQMTGVGEVHLPTGVMTSSNMNMDMSADANIQTQGQSMDMTMSITGTMTQTSTGAGVPAPQATSAQ